MTTGATAGRVLGLDLGARRIGVAVSDADRRMATGVGNIERRGDIAGDHRAIAAMVEEYSAVCVVVGVPLSLSGTAGPAAEAVLAEVEALRGTLGVEVDTVDERLTTVAAERDLRSSGRKKGRRREVVDRIAAAGLLQTWIDRQAAGAANRR